MRSPLRLVAVFGHYGASLEHREGEYHQDLRQQGLRKKSKAALIYPTQSVDSQRRHGKPRQGEIIMVVDFRVK